MGDNPGNWLKYKKVLESKLTEINLSMVLEGMTFLK